MVMGVMSQLALRVSLKAGLKNIQSARDPIRDESAKLDGQSGDSDPCHSAHYGDSYRSVFHLLHHLNHHSPAMRFLCAVTIATLYLKLSEAEPTLLSRDLGRPSGANSQSPEEEEGADRSSELWLLGSAVLRHFLQLRCNAQAIITLQDIGDSRIDFTPRLKFCHSLILSVASVQNISESVGKR